MEPLLTKEIFSQVPALAVLVFTVITFLKHIAAQNTLYIEARKEHTSLLQRMHEEGLEVVRQNSLVIQENSKMLGVLQTTIENYRS